VSIDGQTVAHLSQSAVAALLNKHCAATLVFVPAEDSTPMTFARFLAGQPASPIAAMAQRDVRAALMATCVLQTTRDPAQGAPGSQAAAHTQHVDEASFAAAAVNGRLATWWTLEDGTREGVAACPTLCTSVVPTSTAFAAVIATSRATQEVAIPAGTTFTLQAVVAEMRRWAVQTTMPPLAAVPRGAVIKAINGNPVEPTIAESALLAQLHRTQPLLLALSLDLHAAAIHAAAKVRTCVCVCVCALILVLSLNLPPL
jgi:hypothetical protein